MYLVSLWAKLIMYEILANLNRDLNLATYCLRMSWKVRIRVSLWETIKYADIYIYIYIHIYIRVCACVCVYEDKDIHYMQLVYIILTRDVINNYERSITSGAELISDIYYESSPCFVGTTLGGIRKRCHPCLKLCSYSLYIV